MQRLRAMRVKAYKVWVHRNTVWEQIETDMLLPGDLVLMQQAKSSAPEDKRVIPCDMLILHGNGIVDESILTGESVPQVKESITSIEASETLDKNKHKSHYLNGGT
jgi:manganese-transporting P-type ATPase